MPWQTLLVLVLALALLLGLPGGPTLAVSAQPAGSAPVEERVDEREHSPAKVVAGAVGSPGGAALSRVTGRRPPPPRGPSAAPRPTREADVALGLASTRLRC